MGFINEWISRLDKPKVTLSGGGSTTKQLGPDPDVRFSGGSAAARNYVADLEDITEEYGYTPASLYEEHGSDVLDWWEEIKDDVTFNKEDLEAYINSIESSA